MLMPYVTGLVFAHCITAACLATVAGALRIAYDQKLFGGTLTRLEPTPTRFSG
jgi:hypothetical protein